MTFLGVILALVVSYYFLKPAQIGKEIAMAVKAFRKEMDE